MPCSHCKVLHSIFSKMKNVRGIEPMAIDANGNDRTYSGMPQSTTGRSLVAALGFSAVCDCDDEDGERTDEQFKLTDGNGRPLAQTYYTLRLESGELIYGITDSAGLTFRHVNNGERRIAVYLGHRSSDV